MGGDRLQLPAAARRARRRARARDPLGDAGAGRPARGARRARALPGVPAGRSARPRTRSTCRRPTPGERAALEYSAAQYARGAPTRWRARRPRGAARRARDVDLLGHPRDPPAAGHRRRDPAAGRDRHRRAPRALGRAGAAASGCRSARTRRGWTRCSRRRACGSRAWTSRTSRRARRAPLRSPAGPLLVPLDRPALELVWSRARLPVARRVPRHAPAHGAPPPGVGGRRRALRPGARGRAGARGRGRLRGGACGRAPGCAAWRGTPSCSGCTGTRACSSSRRCSRRPRRPGCGSRRSTSSWPRPEAAPAVLDAATSWGAPRTLDTWSAPACRRARVAPARAPSCARCRAARTARAARAAGAPVLRLGVPDRPRHGGRLPARAGRRARGRAGGRARGAGGPRARSAQPGAVPGRIRLMIGHARFGVPARCADVLSGEVPMLPRRSATSRVPFAVCGGERGTQEGPFRSRGANRRHERGVAQVIRASPSANPVGVMTERGSPSVDQPTSCRSPRRRERARRARRVARHGRGRGGRVHHGRRRARRRPPRSRTCRAPA